jgi:hypothetical protein
VAIAQFFSIELGHLVAQECGHVGCGALFAFTQANYDRVKASQETFYCTNGHPRCFTGQPNLAARLEQTKAQLAVAERLRQEAEQRAADQERERVRLHREVVVERRTTRKAIDVARRTLKQRDPPPAKRGGVVR